MWFEFESSVRKFEWEYRLDGWLLRIYLQIKWANRYKRVPNQFDDQVQV